MPRTEPGEARQIANQICRSFTATHGAAKSTAKVALRFGFASTAEAGHDLRDLVAAADAKLRGRLAQTFWTVPTPASS